jgi:uncharacterized membrane protein YozB (DUF420 family)
MNEAVENNQIWGLWKIGLVAAGVSAVANLVLLFATKPFMDVPDSLVPMTPPAVIIWSLIGALGAIGVFALVRKSSAHPQKTFMAIAIVVLVVSFLPDIVLVNVTEGPFGGASWGAIFVLMIMHVISFAIVMPLLRKFASTAST